MAAFKDFDLLIAEENTLRGEVPTFKLRGVEFRGVVKPSVAGLLKLSVAEGNLVTSVEYISTLIEYSQREQFLAMLREESDDEISADVLNAISEYLTEAYAARPTPA